MVHEKSRPRLRGVGPAKELPPAGNATELFKERLEALLKDAELLKHIDESLHGRYFARTIVETADVLHDYSPDDEGFWETDALITADFSVIDPYRMMPTDGSAEKSTRPIVHA